MTKPPRPCHFWSISEILRYGASNHPSTDVRAACVRAQKVMAGTQEQQSRYFAADIPDRLLSKLCGLRVTRLRRVA